MSATAWTPYLTAGDPAPVGNDVDIYISADAKEQFFGLVFCKTVTIPVIQVTATMAPGVLTFIKPAPSLTVTLKAPLPEILSVAGNFAIWKDDVATAYPDASFGTGWWTDNGGFVVTGDFDTFNLSLYL